MDTIPSGERSAPVPPPQFTDSSEKLSHPAVSTENSSIEEERKLLPRETGHDIGMGSPVPLSKEAVNVITKLRNMKVSVAQLDHSLT